MGVAPSLIRANLLSLSKKSCSLERYHGPSNPFGHAKTYFLWQAIIATGVGIAFSPYAANVLGPREWGGGEDFDNIVLEVTRAVIALSVFAVGVELPRCVDPRCLGSN